MWIFDHLREDYDYLELLNFAQGEGQIVLELFIFLNIESWNK